MEWELKPIQHDTPEWQTFLSIVERIFHDGDADFDPAEYTYTRPHQHFLLFHGDDPAGACTLSLNTTTPCLDESGTVTNFCILPEYRQKGAGRAMSDALDTFARDTHNVKTLTLAALSETFRFYTKMGYVPDDNPELDNPFIPVPMIKKL